MKKFYFLIIIMLITNTVINAQTQQGINYQGIARDNSGNVLANQTVSLRFSILTGSINGSAVYVETQTTTTDGFGLFLLMIGQGTVVSGTFNSINWGSNIYFLKVEIDPAGGTAFQYLGTSQFAAVPYALYSAKSGTTESINESQTLSVNGNNLSISSGNTVSLPIGNLNGMKRFTQSANWTCPDGITKIKVIAIGAGGGGGGSSCTYYQSGGGGSGAYIEDIITVSPGQIYPITIGIGGIAGTPTYNVGATGGATSFSTLVIAGGGSGGDFRSWGLGGSASSVNGFSINGNHGEVTDTYMPNGTWHGTMRGGDTPSPFGINYNSGGDTFGNGGNWYGGGGGGNIGSSSYGGNGANGLLIIYW